MDKHYYLVAYDPTIQDYRHYRVDRMESLTVTDTPRDPLPEQFDLGKYVKTIFDMYNGRTETVQLRFDRALINVVMDRFGADAHIRPDGERIAVTAPVEVGPTFYGWLFQFGGQAELLAPDHVRRDFTEHCRQAFHHAHIGPAHQIRHLLACQTQKIHPFPGVPPGLEGLQYGRACGIVSTACVAGQDQHMHVLTPYFIIAQIDFEINRTVTDHPPCQKLSAWDFRCSL